jgi:hypothetical protein
MKKKVVDDVKNNRYDANQTDEIQKKSDKKKKMYIRIMNEILTELKISANELGALLGKKRSQVIYDILDNSKNVGISLKMADMICEKFPQFNKSYLLTGEGEMLKGNIGNSKKLIPFYDDAATIGGTNEQVADTRGITSPSEYIDAGDWFKNATAAIRHYGDSMTEYPSGCILALKEVHERQLVLWGGDYVIETNEYRITKRVQRGKSDEYIKAYSTNTETYSDGQLIHEPIDIAWESITRILLVLGYVVKKGGGTIVFSNQKK